MIQATSHSAFPAVELSPPETPTAASAPIFQSRDESTRSPLNHKAPGSHQRRQFGATASEPGIWSVGNGPSFTLVRPGRPEQLSPSTSDDMAAASDVGADSDSSGSPPRSVPDSALPDSIQGTAVTISSAKSSRQASPSANASHGDAQAFFIVEELGDFEEGDLDRATAVRPDVIEYAEPDRRQSRSRARHEMDSAVMEGVTNLNCADPQCSEGEDFEPEEATALFRELKRRRRQTSVSLGKRTIDESIGSASDREDLDPSLDVNEVGSSARRVRPRVGDHRRSLQFQDPPPERILEIDEPPEEQPAGHQGEDELNGESLKELPHYTPEVISMEVD